MTLGPDGMWTRISDDGTVGNLEDAGRRLRRGQVAGRELAMAFRGASAWTERFWLACMHNVQDETLTTGSSERWKSMRCRGTAWKS